MGCDRCGGPHSSWMCPNPNARQEEFADLLLELTGIDIDPRGRAEREAVRRLVEDPASISEYHRDPHA